MPQYDPPPLTARVKIRNPAMRPGDAPRGPFGRPASSPDWGETVWAHVRDRAPSLTVEDSAELREQLTVFTIRAEGLVNDIAANAEVVYRTVVYEAVGPPVRRGGAGHGRLAEYLEIHTKRRA